jgi:hypothetical protein
MPKPKPQDLPGVEGPGVSRASIPEIDKAIAKYERKKEARCQASPDEIAAKNEVKSLLHQHRDQLPVNGDGVPFYRTEERDYILEEKLRVHKFSDESEDED